MTTAALLRRRFSNAFAALAFTGAALSAFAPLAHADELDTITKAGVVRVGVFEDYPPFGSIGPDMKPQGYDIDVANLIGKSLGVKVELVAVTGDNRMAYLADHKADMLLSVGQTPEREKVIDFSTPYVMIGGKLLVRKGSAIHNLQDLHGKPVAFALGGSAQQDVQRVVPDIQPVVFNDPPLAVQAVIQEKAVAMIADGSQLYYYAQNNPALMVTGEAWAPKPLAIGLRKDDPKWRREIDTLLADFYSDGSYAATYRKYLGADPDPGFSIARPSNP